PCFLGLDVALPERPGAALSRPDRVDGAALLPVVEDAVAGSAFAQRPAPSGHPCVQTRHLLDGFAAKLRKGGQLLVVDPDVGRAAQMNHGAAHATGDVLLFLHADCRLEPGALAAARRTLTRRTVAGCFRMRVEAEGMLYRLIDACATARVHLTGIAYGDQGLF